MKKNKTTTLVKTDSIVKNYSTRSVMFDIEVKQGEGNSMTMTGEYLPEKKKVLINHLTSVVNQHLTLEQVMLLSGGLASLVDIIKQKELLRELAEGFGDSIESHKAKK